MTEPRGSGRGGCGFYRNRGEVCQMRQMLKYLWAD